MSSKLEKSNFVQLDPSFEPVCQLRLGKGLNPSLDHRCFRVYRRVFNRINRKLKML